MTDSSRKAPYSAEREPDLTAGDPYRILGIERP